MNQQYKNELDRLIGESLEKPGKDDGPVLFDFLFNRSKPVGERFEMNGQPKSKKQGHICSVCNTFYFDSENMIGNDGICKSCWDDLKELEDDGEGEIEVLHREEKKGKAI